MRALKLTALVVAIAAIVIVCGGWAIGRQAPVSPGEMYIGPETAKTLDFLEAKFGLSRSAAVDMLHRTAAQPGHGPVVDRLDLPRDAILDFIEVNGAAKSGPIVRYLGSARAFAADSQQGRDFYAMYRDAALRNHWSSALKAMDNLRAHGTVLAPAAFGVAPKPAAGKVGTASAGTVKTAAAATTYRVAVICAEFPEFLDIAPNASAFYFPVPPDATIPYRNVSVSPAPYTSLLGNYIPNLSAVDWYLTGPGGAVPANSGASIGTAVQWNYRDGFGTGISANGAPAFQDHPARLADARDGATSAKLQNYWYRRLFDMNYTGTDSANDIGGYIGSLASYYWDQSFGNVALAGDTSDIYGWVSSRHTLDRRMSASGPPMYMVQPGTPVKRASSTIMTDDGTSGTNPPILRASLTNNKLTILFRDEQLSGFTPVAPYLDHFTAFQYNIDAAGKGVNGTVTVYIQGGVVPGTVGAVNSNVQIDPYDYRRVTWLRGSWKYMSAAAPPAAPPATIDFAIAGGTDWSVTVGGDTWQNGHFGWASQDGGCAPLKHTLFTNADTLNAGADSQAGSRMKSFDYYCHDYYNNTNGPYQITHIFHNGQLGTVYDDIGGEYEPASDPVSGAGNRVKRPYPFDIGLPSTIGGGDRMQLGFFHFPKPDNAAPTDGGGDHSSGGMETDVVHAMADQNIVMNGAYQRTIFVFAGGSVGENSGNTTGSNESATWGTIISHAGGGQVTVGEDCGLGTMAHEMGHTLGFGDLYDSNFYTNKLGSIPPYPQYFECVGMNPYSVMAMGGTRVDPALLAQAHWATPTVVNTDIIGAYVPQMENSARTPSIYKFPANPYELMADSTGASWTEYFLMEFRGQGFRGNANAPWWGDPAPRGVYLYRVSPYGQNVQNPDYSFHPEGYIPEQADGLFELENNLMDGGLLQFYPGTAVGAGNLQGDPFGVDGGNAASNHNFTQWPFNLATFYANYANSGANLGYAPTSNSKGNPDASATHPTPGTDTDSFARVLNIQVAGGYPNAYATADLYVTPREIVATGTDMWPTVANKTLDPWYVDSNVNPLVWQGQSNVPVMQLKLDNQANAGAADYMHMSKGDVTIRSLRVLQSGSSSLDSDVTLVKLWDIKNPAAKFNPSDPTQCTLLATTTLQGKVASFGTPDPSVHSDMNYNVALGGTKYLLVTYDISTKAQVKPSVNLAADFPDPKYVWPQPPGSVQQKARTATAWSFGANRFPIQNNNTATLIKGTDTLFIASTSVAPSTVKPSDRAIPVLTQTLTAQKDQIAVHQLHYVCSPGNTPVNAQQDVGKAYLYWGTVTGGALNSGAVKISEAVFSATNDLVFDNLDTVQITVPGVNGGTPFYPLVVNAGTPVPLVIVFDMSGDPKSVGDYLELQLTDASASSIVLLDEDGPGNTIYQDPADATHFADAAHGAVPATWTLVAGQDQVNASGAPWKSTDFRVNPPTLPMLSQTAGQPLFTPDHGDQHSTFAFRVTYASSNNVKPVGTGVNLVYRVPGAATDTTVAMSEVDATDTNYVDGKAYIAQVAGLTAYGVYKFYFTASDGMTTVYFYAPLQVGGTQATPGSFYTAPRDLGDYIKGPLIGSPSTTEFFDFNYTTTRSYEEGRTTDSTKNGYQLLKVRVTDADANLDHSLIDHVAVTLKGTGTGADTEPLSLTETGINTGIFEGSIPTLGKTGAASDGVFNAIAGTAGQSITATYKDAQDTPPGANDTSMDTAMVVDTRAPDPIPAATLDATIDPAGTSIVLDWTGYEATQIDVAGYKVYVTTTPFTDVSGLTPTATLAAGAHSYTATTTTEQTYYIAVCPFDEVPNMWKTTTPLPDTTPGITVLSEDTDHNAAPFIVPGSQAPAPNATGVLPSARTIQFQVQDTGIGINTNDTGAITLKLSVNGAPETDIKPATTITPGATVQDPVSLVYTRPTDWNWGDAVTIHVIVKDKSLPTPNTLDTSWTFHVATDNTAPTLDMASLIPTNGATGVARNQVVFFHLLDDVAGVDLTTINLQIQINGGAFTPITTLTGLTVTPTDATQREVDCTYTKPGGFAYNDVVNFRVTCADRAFNAMAAPATWGFSIYTTAAGLSIPSSSFVPANGATNVSRTTIIQFRVLDSVSTITPATIGLSIDGTPIPHASLNITGTSDNYLVTYTPAVPFGFFETHSCVATASDAAANNATSGPWSWTTIPDTTGPIFTLISPASTASPLPVSTTVVVRVTDVDSLVNPASITGTITGGATPTLSSAVPAHTIDVTFAPPPNLPGSSTINVHVAASDTAAPTPNSGTGDFSFTTLPAPTFTIVGRITNSVGGGAISAVQVNLTGAATASTLTDGNGFYQFKNLLSANYTVTPSSTAWSFAPDHRDITLTGNVNNADFTATQIAYALRGHITLNGNPLAGVNVSVGARSTTTLGDGSYAITGLVPASYTVTPSLTGYTFTPASLPATIGTGDVTGLDFTAVALTFSISGVVSDNNGNRLAGVSVTAGTGSATTADTGRYTIGGVPTGTVSVQVTKAGYLFFWIDSSAVYHLVPEVLSVPPDRTDINFVGYPVTSQSFSAGFHMLGVPIFPRDPSPVSVFGTDLLARWDPTTGVYATARAVAPNELLTTNVAPGIGFWAFFTGPVTLQVAGSPVSTATPYPLATLDGWNMLANPFLTQLPFANVSVVSGSVRPFAYTYDPVSGSYLLIAASPGIGIARSYILPWEAMWILSTGSSSLTATAGAGSASADDVKALQLDLGQNGWYLPVTARAGDRHDECCAVGVRASGAALSLEKPPAMSNSVDVAVLNAAGDRLSRSIATAGKAKYQWDLLVTTDLADTDVAVALPDLSKVPSSMRVMLTDVDANKTVYMRTTAQYTFHTATTGTTLRHLQLTVESGTGAGLVITSASARAAGSHVTVTYTASAPCSVTATVLNIAGRSVRTLAASAPAAAGVNTLSWDGRSTSGSPVPSGIYLVQLDAVADSGQRVRSVTQLNLSGRR